MPYVTIQAFSREKLLEFAQHRWQIIRRDRPDLEPALTLQRELLTCMIDLAESLAHGKLPRLSLPPSATAASTIGSASPGKAAISSKLGAASSLASSSLIFDAAVSETLIMGSL